MIDVDTVSGHLHLVDLAAARFRLRDAAGNDVLLDGVVDADRMAGLVGELVTAAGEVRRDARGRVTALVVVQVEPLVWPTWRTPTLADVDFISPRSPVSAGIEGVDDAEVAAFLALIRR